MSLWMYVYGTIHLGEDTGEEVIGGIMREYIPAVRKQQVPDWTIDGRTIDIASDLRWLGNKSDVDRSVDWLKSLPDKLPIESMVAEILVGAHTVCYVVYKKGELKAERFSDSILSELIEGYMEEDA